MEVSFLFFILITSVSRFILIMKSQNSTKEGRSRNSSRQEQKKSTLAVSNNFFKKISQSIPLGMPSKSIFLNSQRGSKPKVQPIKIPMHSQQPTINHSRKASMNSTTGVAMSGRTQIQNSTRESKQISRRKEKEHNRSNSTISKKSQKDMKNCFKIDLSKFKDPPKEEKEDKQIARQHFECIYVVGKGGFGKVWCVRMKKTQKIYAMKQMHKTKIIGKKSIHSVLNQRQLLSRLKHPFIVNMSFAFQDRQNLYLIMDLLVGGDLRYHMGCRRHFSELQSKFFIGCILIGLEFLHLNNIIHRDIKPENLVFDDKGYLRITDLGIARAVKPNNSADTSGTPGYMAPQVMCRQDHSFPVDYYAVGVIAYELMLGRRPYNGRNRKEIRDQILSKQVGVRSEDVPKSWSLEAADFINKMIQRKPAQRLGSQHGIIQIKDHPWFKNFPWVQLLKKNIASPYVPINVLNSKDYRQQISSSSQQEDLEQNRLLLRKKSVQQLFQGYCYYSKEIKQTKQIKEKKSTNASSTGATHYSYIEERQGNPQARLKNNNYMKPYC